MLRHLIHRSARSAVTSSRRCSTAVVGDTPITSVLSSEFDRDQESKILDLLNNVSSQKLRQLKYFTTQKALNLVKYRDEYGEFATLSDVLAVPGFGVLGVKRIAKAILNNETTEKKSTITAESYKTRSSICHPRVPPEKCGEIQSVVSIDVQQDALFWVHMDRTLTVEDWNKTYVFTTPTLKYDHAEYHHNLHHALTSLPSADVYLFESKMYRYQYLKIVPVIVSLRLMEAIAITMLNHHHFTQCAEHCVHTIKPHAVSNFFNLIVGGERVSCQHIARDIINRCSDHAGDVQVPDHLADYFYGLQHADQENLTRALLLPILFYKKVVFPGSSGFYV